MVALHLEEEAVDQYIINALKMKIVTTQDVMTIKDGQIILNVAIQKMYA